jgi:glyoxylase-like metal-dependent hydrolase (beta-lactamase superfamily II)
MLEAKTVFTEIVPGIFSVDHQIAEGKNGIVIGQRRVLVIDACNSPEEAQAMTDFIRARERRPDLLVFTHGHGDHVLGSGIFAEAEVIASVLTPGEIRRILPKVAERMRTPLAQLEAQIAWPTITFSGELHIDLGDKHVHLFPTPGHSDDSISIYVAEQRVLFAGDAMVTGIVPAIGDGDSRTLETSLHRLMGLDVDIMVPGHGPVLYGREHIRDWLEWTTGYLSGVRARVHVALQNGLSEDACLESVGFDELIGSRLATEKHAMPKRHRDTVSKIMREELDRTVPIRSR